ncbi:AraC family transcriptional regulator [Ruficoccus sp. ZRK36]|uniref:helix-turn-helix domain-containing protein n=1 Tax=Ruficoccus sp. ZRK36 TaxID=2866311 RepID=UPI001C72F2E6|nr:AraC family transcriptional regulator [Ruficoccus sp. ZRK36]QYY37455.1 helix-turn-helix domain-containing protein [Ruficoccus sp. ZRK36]
MPIEPNSAWDQHLDKLNHRRAYSPIEVSLVQIEGHKTKSWKHTEHVHPYWQMEVVETGGFTIRFGEKKLRPKDRDIVLIPPQCSHLFIHPQGKLGWTFKFSADELTSLYPVSTVKPGPLRNCLHQALLDTTATGDNPDEETRVVIEHLIAAVLAIHIGEKRPSLVEDEMISAAKKLVESRVAAGKSVRVGELAETAGCSTQYLNRIFKRYLGMPAKKFVDQYRFEVARRLLLESPLPVGEIATELGFPDAFQFSRFFKRVGGDSPRAFRDRHTTG